LDDSQQAQKEFSTKLPVTSFGLVAQWGYTLFTNYSHTDKKDDNFRQQIIVKETTINNKREPIGSKRMRYKSAF
jgi:hypothetical protein